MYNLKLPKQTRALYNAVIIDWQAGEELPLKRAERICTVSVGSDIWQIESPQDFAAIKMLKPRGIIFSIEEPFAVAYDSTDNSETTLNKSDKMGNLPKSSDAKVIPILMPQAGQTMEEGTILSWRVKPGDMITVGQIIFEIETDKANIEVEAVDSGRLAKIVAQVGQIVPVKTPVAYIADQGVDIDAYLAGDTAGSAQIGQVRAQPQAASVQQTKATETAVVEDFNAARKRISPAARKLAEQKGIDISALGTGSGPQGRIVTGDLENIAAVSAGPKTLPMSKMRKAIAQNLAFSKQNIPHFYIKLTVEAQKLFDLYKQTKQKFACTVNDFVVLACAKAIRQHPGFRSQYKEDGIVESAEVNIGVAVGLDDGLVVPTILNADKMKFDALCSQSRVVIENARKGKIEGMGRGVFTITNLGMFGIEEFSAIINPPQSAILAVGAIREDIKVENGAIRPTRLMTLTLSVDHRVIDGVAAAKFLQTLKGLLEDPGQLVE